MEGENEETERREQGIENERIELLVLVFNNQSAGQIMHQEEGGGRGRAKEKTTQIQITIFSCVASR